jgi:signal transduction histidine kinase
MLKPDTLNQSDADAHNHAVISRLDQQVYRSTLAPSILNILATTAFMGLDSLYGSLNQIGFFFGIANILINVPRIFLARSAVRGSAAGKLFPQRELFVFVGAAASFTWICYAISVLIPSGSASDMSKLALIFSTAHITSAMIVFNPMYKLAMLHVGILGGGQSLALIIGGHGPVDYILAALAIQFAGLVAFYVRKNYLSMFNLELLLITHENENRTVKALINAVPGFMTLLDHELSYVMTNDAFQKRIGKAVVGTKLGETTSDTDFVKLVQRFVESNKSHDLLETRFGPLFEGDHFLVSLTKLESPADHIAIVSIDVEPQKIVERDLHHARIEAEHSSRLATIGELVSTVSHEIRNPLAVLSGRADILRRMAKQNKSLEGEALVTEATKTQDMVQRITKIIETVLKYGRTDISSQPMSEVPVRQILEDVVFLTQSKASKQGVEFRLPREVGDSSFECYAVQISQVLVNLLNNAIDAASELEEKWVELSAKFDDTFIEFKVVDSGSGIPADLRQKIAMPFFTTKPEGKGTGLGLSLCRNFIDNHRGDLSLDSSAVHTTFVVRLPLKQVFILSDSNAS